ncbi:hypothetical protein AYL99_01599 [Fonsecaea erecta]|uniref:Uncharacterized protein n=1 Tax=Fonsecaea erecta TaxID=1367422 RepID=A0A179A0W0_9EURO|nr:hypothetical protein AYL99_01599 [Fonsecaea erecta]OAP65627.1 hypothetical protein AYL99_01599 [Fonsecaea erecta]
MAHTRAPQDLSPQDSTFLFINTLQEQLAKSDFVNNINNNNKPTEPHSARGPSAPSTPSKPNKEGGRTSVVASSSSSSSSSTAMKPTVPKWSDKDSQGARITRLKPPRQAK